ncbi:hypothetical protein ES705_17157 [subsurface metagenome]
MVKISKDGDEYIIKLDWIELSILGDALAEPYFQVCGGYETSHVSEEEQLIRFIQLYRYFSGGEKEEEKQMNRYLEEKEEKEKLKSFKYMSKMFSMDRDYLDKMIEKEKEKD